jgi:DNA-binding CsgD family transcriptional regulator
MMTLGDSVERRKITHRAAVPRREAPDGSNSLETKPQRRLVEQADAEFGVVGDLARVWSEIRRGDSIVADAFCTQSRHFVVLTPATEHKRVSPSDCRLLERVLLSDSQKRIAIDSGISESTLSMQSQRALNAIGSKAAPSKAPLVFAFLVRASEHGAPEGARVSRLSDGSTEYGVVSMPRPEQRFELILTLAEYEVLCFLVEGWSYARIAFTRKTSVRTVANQVASVFRRLGVSGRSELISLLVAGLTQTASEPPCRPSPSP